MRTPDPAYRIYTENSILHLQKTLRDLNAKLIDPATPAHDVIATAKLIKVTEHMLRVQHDKQAKRMANTEAA